MEHAAEIISGLCGLIISILCFALTRVLGTYDKTTEKLREDLEDLRLQIHECDNRISIIESFKRF